MSILNTQKEYFKTLFSSEGYNVNDANDLLSHLQVRLTENEKHFCDKDISEKEIYTVIKSMKPNKSPGYDGIISEFYQKYWYLIKNELIKVIKSILENNTLSPSQSKAILTLLYKKGEREDISNWRPISLLNTDYKIITKVLAERKIIHPDPKGFISGRNISDANRLLQDMISYSGEQGINSSIIFIDYQKAFDRVEWPWALKCLE